MNAGPYKTEAFFQNLGANKTDQSILYQFTESLIHNNIDGVIGYGTDLKVILWNPAISHITGYAEEEALQQNIFDLLPFLIGNPNAFYLEKVLVGESFKTPDAEYYIPEKNRAGYYTAKIFPVFNNEHKIYAGLIIFSVNTGRKSAEQKQKESLNFIERAMNTLGHAVYITDPEYHQVLYANIAFEKVSGFNITKENEDGLLLLHNLIHPDDRVKINGRHNLLKDVQDGEVVKMEIRIKEGADTWRWYSFTSTVFKRNESGKVIQIITALQDIHDRKEAEMFLSMILQHAPGGIMVLKPVRNEQGYIEDLQFVLRNKNMEALSALQDDIITGQSIFKLYPEIIQKGLDKLYYNTLETGNPSTFEYEYSHDRLTGWFRAEGVKMGDYLLLTVENLTNNRTTEKELQEKKNFIEGIIHSLPDSCVFILDLPKPALRFISENVVDLLGYTVEDCLQITSKGLFQLVHPEDFPDFRLFYKAVREAKDEEVVEYTCRIMHKKSGYRYISTKASVLKRTAEGQVWQIVFVSHDRTEQTETQQLLQKVIQNSSEGFIVLEAVLDENRQLVDFKIVLTNLALEKFSGKTSEQMVNRRIPVLWPHLYGSELFNAYSQVYLTGDPYETELYYDYPEEIKGFYRIKAKKFQEGIIIFYTDITDINNKDQALQEAYGKLLDVQELAELGTYEWAITDNNLHWSKRHYEIFELDPGTTEPSLEVFKHYIHPEDLSSVEEVIRTFIAHPKKMFQEYRIITPGGKLKYVQNLMKPIFSRQGKLVKMLGYAQDISETKQHSIKLQQSNTALLKAQDELQAINNELADRVIARTREVEERNRELKKIIEEFRFVSDFMPQMVWVTQADGNPDFLNRRWYEFSGLTYQETKDKGWSRILHPEDYERTWLVWKESLETGKLYETEYRMRRFDGEFVWFLARALPLRDSYGKIVKWFGTCTDIQEQRNTLDELNITKDRLNAANDELQKKNQRLQYLNVELDNFVYRASHDLRAPLNTIEGLIGLLSNPKADDSELKEILRFLGTSVKRLKETVKDLTSIAEATKESEDTEVIQLEEMLREIKEDIPDLIKNTDVRIIQEFAVPAIHYSRKDTRSILYNLLSNAIKYRSSERIPLVKICSRAEGEFVVLEVEDNGLGLKEEDIPKVFQKFTRLHTHTEGTGLGMYILKRMLENAGGRIEVDSTPDQGSVFRAYLWTAKDLKK